MDMDRRTFLSRAAAGAGVALVAARARAEAPAVPQGDVQLSFCVVADPHCAEQPKEGIEQYGGGTDKFVRCLTTMDAMTGADRPEFVLLAGDIHPWALEDELDGLPFTIYATPGNHESNRERRDALHAAFPAGFRRNDQPSDYYSVVHEGVRIISVCDAGAGGDHVGHLCSELIAPSGQCEWLEDELRRPEKRKVLFAHIPPQLDGLDQNMYLSRNDSRWFTQLLADEQPDAAFFGHLHTATHEHAVGATRCLNVRSCCWNFGRAPIGFLHVRVRESGLEIREIETGAYT